MTNSINTSQISNLENNIRISATSSFNAKDAYETIFEDVISKKTLDEETEKINQTQNRSLGAPPGFWNIDESDSLTSNVAVNFYMR